MIKLSNRLHKVADMLTPTFSIADIGCDHAHTSIYLIQKSIAKKVIAMDINKGPIERAKENVSIYGCSDKIDVRISDGAKELGRDEVDSILISGMGGRLVVKILTESYDKISRCKEIVLQPQSEIYLVRQYIQSIGFSIVKEDFFIDDNKYYVIIKAVNEYNEIAHKLNYGVSFCENVSDISFISAEDMYGEYLLKKQNSTLKKYLEHELYVCKSIIDSLVKKVDSTDEFDKNEKIVRRLEELKQKEVCIRKGLSYYEV